MRGKSSCRKHNIHSRQAPNQHKKNMVVPPWNGQYLYYILNMFQEEYIKLQVEENMKNEVPSFFKLFANTQRTLKSEFTLLVT